MIAAMYFENIGKKSPPGRQVVIVGFLQGMHEHGSSYRYPGICALAVFIEEGESELKTSPLSWFIIEPEKVKAYFQRTYAS